MALILNIETSSNSTSVALAEDGVLLKAMEEHNVVSHASKLTPFIEEVLKNAHKKTSDLNAIAISIGPGSYTGLRIGLSVAKGLCYALKIPIIAISSLDSLAVYLKNNHSKNNKLFVSVMNSRKNEIYATILNNESEEKKGPDAVVLDNTFLAEYKNQNIVIGGTGLEKVKEVLLNENVEYIENVNFSALFMIKLTFNLYLENKFEDLAYIEPKYLKPFITT